MTSARQSPGLQIIFSIFLGLMVTAFVGVGVYTFYPPAEMRYRDQLESVRRQQEDVRGFRDPAALNDADRERLGGLEEQVRELEDAQQAAREVWGRNTSMVLIVLATLVMAVSLVRAEQLPVISNGLLLGGVFTMAYGVGWIIANGTSYTRFAVMTVALAITLALGYVRFVRTRRAAAGTGVAAAEQASRDVTELAARLDAIERRLRAASASLGAEAERGERM